jgi:hypothetical protein
VEKMLGLDFSYALRAMGRRRGYALTAVLTIAMEASLVQIRDSREAG